MQVHSKEPFSQTKVIQSAFFSHSRFFFFFNMNDYTRHPLRVFTSKGLILRKIFILRNMSQNGTKKTDVKANKEESRCLDSLMLILLERGGLVL